MLTKKKVNAQEHYVKVYFLKTKLNTLLRLSGKRADMFSLGKQEKYVENKVICIAKSDIKGKM